MLPAVCPVLRWKVPATDLSALSRKGLRCGKKWGEPSVLPCSVQGFLRKKCGREQGKGLFISQNNRRKKLTASALSRKMFCTGKAARVPQNRPRR